MDRVIKMGCPGGGLYIIEGEVCLLMTAMRRSPRWSSHFNQDDEQDEQLKGLSALKETLNTTNNLSQLEPRIFLAPFLEIIRSETTGPVTSLALTTVHKIISYGLIDSNHSTVASCVATIADAITNARFIGTDASGDEVVLMKILQVLRALALDPIGDYLSNESICEIMLNCFRICFEIRLNELLKRTAEYCLRDIVQHLFTRLPQFIDDTSALLNMEKMRANNNIDTTRNKNRKNKISKQKSKTSTDELEETQSSSDKVKSNSLADASVSPVGSIVDIPSSMNNEIDNFDPSQEQSKNSDNPEIIQENITETEKNDVITSTTNDEEVKIESKISEEEGQFDQSIELEKSVESIQSPQGSIEDLSIDENSLSKTSKIESETVEEYVNSRGVRFMVLNQIVPYGALCIRELFRFLISLCSPLEKKNNEVMINLGLSLLQMALEIAGDALANFPSLLALAKDDLCRNLILLLGTDRLSILAVNLQVSFLLFESQREHLKFQMEHFIVKLMEMINSNKIGYKQRELALEAIVKLWRIPGLPAELYINYDCGLYCTNLYKNLMKLLSESASDLMENMHSMQFISLDAIIMLITGIETRCKDREDLCKSSRHESSANLPTRDELLSIKAKKEWLILGTEKFNKSAKEGISELTKHELLGGTPGHPDVNQIAKFLKENPGLDKKVIGEYISKRDNMNILDSFVHNFDFKNIRIDQALRLYLESFRLPGEAPLISLVVEKFAEHWHDSNGKPFASADAAFLLAYAIVLLNVDQHSHVVRKQNNQMTADQFKRNLRKVNGGADLDQDMLDEIYISILNEEIVMPAEQTGLVKENYLWKVLLRRGCGAESSYLKVGNSGKFIDKELAEYAWAPMISALCKAYHKATDRSLLCKITQTFFSCATISAHYDMYRDLDTLVVSLCKFTKLTSKDEPERIVLHLNSNERCQLATLTLFEITRWHGSALRGSWKNIIDSMQTLYKAKLLPTSLTEGEDFVDPTGKVSLIRESTTPKPPPSDQSIFSSLYSYIAPDLARAPYPGEVTAKKRQKVTEFISTCFIEQVIKESKFVLVDSLHALITALVSVNPHDEDVSVFLLEVLLEVTIENRDRVECIWSIVQAYLDGLLTTAARENHPYLLERVTVGLLRLAIRLLREEKFARIVLPPLVPLIHLPSVTSAPLSRQISYGLYELLKTGAANIYNTEDWKVVFSLLECSGAGAVTPKPSTNSILNDTRSPVLDARPISPVPEWVLVLSPTGTEAPLPVAADMIVLDRDLQPHDPWALIKCCDSLSFLVKDMVHVTPLNFELCVSCVRTFAEAVLQCVGKRNKINRSTDEPPPIAYQQCPIKLLNIMYTLHTTTAQMFRWWAEEDPTTTEGVSLWSHVWRPLLQGIARLCCDARKQVRVEAIRYLQTTLLAHESTSLTAIEWSQCLEQVLFPLLAQLLGPIAIADVEGVEEIRMRAAMLLSKVFLHHLHPLSTLAGFLPLWLTVLDLLRAYMYVENSECLFEAIPESLKNMLLVMSSANVLTPDSNLWTPTWRTIDGFLPNLKGELFAENRTKEPVVPSPPSSPVDVQPDIEIQPQVAVEQVITLLNQCSPNVVASPVTIQPAVQQVFHEPEEKENHWKEGSITDFQHIDSSEAGNINSGTATMFNSAAYFIEDPATDHLFGVTNP